MVGEFDDTHGKNMGKYFNGQTEISVVWQAGEKFKGQEDSLVGFFYSANCS